MVECSCVWSKSLVRCTSLPYVQVGDERAAGDSDGRLGDE